MTTPLRAFTTRTSRRRFLRLAGSIVAAGTLAPLLAACGDDDGEDAEATNATPTSTSDEPTSTQTETPTEEETEEETPDTTATATATSTPATTATATATTEPDEESTPADDSYSYDTTAPEETVETEVAEDTEDSDDDPDQASTESTEHLVEIIEEPSLSFNPEHITISVGDSIRWVNVGTMTHTATCDPERMWEAENAHLPEGAETWHSGGLTAGEEFVHTLEVAGDYQYACLSHELAGQIGTITVEPA